MGKTRSRVKAIVKKVVEAGRRKAPAPLAKVKETVKPIVQKVVAAGQRKAPAPLAAPAKKVVEKVKTTITPIIKKAATTGTKIKTAVQEGINKFAATTGAKFKEGAGAPEIAKPLTMMGALGIGAGASAAIPNVAGAPASLAANQEALARTAQGLGIGQKASSVYDIGYGYGSAPSAAYNAAAKIMKVGMAGAGNVKSISLLNKILAGLGLSTFAVGLGVAVLSDKIFGGFIGEESIQSLSYACNDAMKNGLNDVAKQCLIDERALLAKIPIINKMLPWRRSQKALETFYEIAQKSNAIRQKILDNEQVKITNKEDEKAYWERVNQQKFEQEKYLIDYYNQQRDIAFKAEQEARAAANAAERSAERASAEETAEMWAAYAAEQRRFEEEERKAIAEFWIAYWKEKLRMQEESGGFSTLKFRYL